MARYLTLYKGNNRNNIIKDDPDLFLLHVYYHKVLNKLYVLYKRYSNGEKLLHVIDNPYVPIYLAKSNLKESQESIPVESAHCYIVPYKDKAKEAVSLLFDAKLQRYKDEWGLWVEKAIYPDIPYKAEGLHPRLFLYDIPIEQLCYMEYGLNHMAKHGDLIYEEVPIPDIDYASFDIETNVNENGEWIINTNTFVDEKSKTAYIDFLRSDKYARQNEIIENPDKFKNAVKEAMRDMIANCSLSGKSKDSVQKLCTEFIDNLNINVRWFDREEDLITNTTKTMFTDFQPDILMAYNTTYDVGMFDRRINALNLPKGTFNQRGIGAENIEPPLHLEILENGEFKGDTIVPTKRVVYLNNISHTVISDLQTCYYSNRSQLQPENFKLNTLAESVLGFGKYDFTHITPDITKLAETDFWFHSIYALIDSILLVLINHIGSEFTSKLNFCMSSKTNLEATAQSNTATTRGMQVGEIVAGHLPAVNINAILKNLSREDVKRMEDLLDVEFMPLYENILHKPSFGGGIVADTNLYGFNFNDSTYSDHYLWKEAVLTLFRRMTSLAYEDLKSHYPTTITTRNQSKGTLYGKITDIWYMNTTLATIYDNKDSKKKYANFGSVNMSIINRDVVAYGHICNGLPNLTEIIEKTLVLDSIPKFTKKEEIKCNCELTKEQQDFCKILKTINTNVLTDSEEGYQVSDTGMFLVNDGIINYKGTGVKYKYLLPMILPIINYNEMLYGEIVKNELYIDNNYINKCNNPLWEVDSTWSEWHKVPYQEWCNMLDNSGVFSYELKLVDDIKVNANKNLFYYPWPHWNKQGRDIEVVPIYRFKHEDHTTKLIFMYNITNKTDTISVNIEQYMQVLKY